MTRPIAFSIVAFLSLVIVSHAWAAEPRAGWKAVPENGVINEPGRYCLTNDLFVDRNPGIEVQTDDVTIDLGGHSFRFTGKPKSGVNGIVASGRSNLTICNGAVGGFWFNVHSTDCKGLRIHHVKFDDIPYIGINASKAKDMVISDNEFTNYRYDIPKGGKDHYVIAINTGPEDAIICNNVFNAQTKPGTGDTLDVETVFVLFSAEVSKNCVVAHNEMKANEVLNRGYAIWIATGSQAIVTNNTVSNLQYGVCLGGAASAVVCFNEFSVDAPKGGKILETYGVSATGAKFFKEFDNEFRGFSIPVNGPQTPEPDQVGAN
jgi:hypothetical protein